MHCSWRVSGSPCITDPEYLKVRIYHATQAKMSGRANILKTLKKTDEQWRIRLLPPHS
jgi:hypothetical protein